MDNHVGRHTNMMGSSGMSRWEADMLLALTMQCMGHRCAIHVASCERQMCLLLVFALLQPQAWPPLIKVTGPFNMG